MHIDSAQSFRNASLHCTTETRLAVDRVIELVSKERKVSSRKILSGSRSQLATARARQLSMYLAHVVMRQSLTSIGAAFGRDRTTVSYACGLIEDMRDDAAFDAEVCRLEMVLEAGGVQ